MGVHFGGPAPLVWYRILAVKGGFDLLHPGIANSEQGSPTLDRVCQSSSSNSDSPNEPNNDNDDQDKHNCSHSDVHVDPPL